LLLWPAYITFHQRYLKLFLHDLLLTIADAEFDDFVKSPLLAVVTTFYEAINFQSCFSLSLMIFPPGLSIDTNHR
jgi:hypothetical protein